MEDSKEMPESPESPNLTTDLTQESDASPEMSPETPATPVVDGPSEPPVNPGVTTSQPEPKKSKGRLATVLLIILVLVAAGAVAYYYLKLANKTSNVAAKKDITTMSYELSNGAPLNQVYPTEDAADNSIQTNSQLFEGLVRYQSQSRVIPLLATSWSNPDNSTWVFNLAQGVKFHDGNTLTAQDVKASLDYAVAHQGDEDGNLVLALARTIKSVAVTGTYQVKITTNGPDPVLLNRLTYLYIFDSKAKLGDTAGGTGPYVVKSGTKATASNIDLVAFDGYHGGHVYTREVRIASNTTDANMVKDLNNGKADLAGGLNADDLAKLTTAGYQKLTIPDMGTSFLGLNTLKTSSPLSSLAARQAAAYALNVPAILKASGLQGKQISQLIPPLIPGYDPSITNTPYNPTKAKQLLAGVKNASTPLTLNYPAQDASIANEIAKELNAVGFNVTAVNIPDFSNLISIALGGKTDMYYITYTSNTLDGLDILSSVVQGNKDYNDTQVNQYLNPASTTLDPATRIGLLQKASRQIAKDLPDIPIYNVQRTYVVRNPAYHVQVDMPSTAAGVYFWQVYQ